MRLGHPGVWLVLVNATSLPLLVEPKKRAVVAIDFAALLGSDDEGNELAWEDYTQFGPRRGSAVA